MYAKQRSLCDHGGKELTRFNHSMPVCIQNTEKNDEMSRQELRVELGRELHTLNCPNAPRMHNPYQGMAWTLKMS